MSDITITYQHSWDMGHRLPRHEGKCARLHGHRYVAEIDVTGPVQTGGSATGMVVDFYIVKDMVKKLIDEQWDHRTMLWENDVVAKMCFVENVRTSVERTCRLQDAGVFIVPFMPTAENIAKEILERLRAGDVGQGGRGLNITRVRVYETPNGWAEARA